MYLKERKDKMKDTNKAVAESEASGTSAAIAGGGTEFRRLARRNYWKAHWPLYAFVAPTVIFMLVFKFKSRRVNNARS